MLIADNFATFVNMIYADPHSYSGMTIFAAMIIFVVELYCDFSGYADIAIGSAKVLGFNLTENFNYPFSATSVTDFWRRWHISLSSWIRDYVFTPLAYRWRALSKIGVVCALIFSFALIGLWHGASWNFILFGLLQGIFVSLEFLTSRIRHTWSINVPIWISEYFGKIYVFIFWAFSLSFFRAVRFGDAIYIVNNAFAGIIDFIHISFTSLFVFSIQPILPTLRIMHSATTNNGHGYFVLFFFLMSLFIFLEWVDTKEGLISAINKAPTFVRWVICLSLVLGITNFGATLEIPFIYFQF